MNTFEVIRDPTGHVNYNNANFVKKKYFAVINVSDTECQTHFFMHHGIPSYWIPIHEVWQWGYSPFYTTAKVLDLKNKQRDNRPILIHCHAGVNRSACVAYAISKADNILTEELRLKIEWEDPSMGPSLFEDNVRRGFIPYDIIEFLKARHEYPTYGIMGLLQVIKSKNTHLRKI